MKRRDKKKTISGIVWLWLMLLLAAAGLTAAARAVVAAAPPASPEKDFVPSVNLPADAAVAFPVDI